MSTCRLEFRSFERRRRYLPGPNYKHSTHNGVNSKMLVRRLFWRHHCGELFTESIFVLREQVEQALVIRRTHHQPYVPWFANSKDDLRIIIVTGIGNFLPGYR